MIIYRAINKVNGKSYIGLTTLTLDQRKQKHWANSRNLDKSKKQSLYLAINKYGWENFDWQELCSALTKEDLIVLEREFIKEYNSYDNGYNNTLGGEGVNDPRKLEQYIVKYPDGSVHLETGYKKFCREHELNEGNLWHTYKPHKKDYHIKGKFYTYWVKAKSCKGYVLLGKFNDYRGSEYIQELLGGNDRLQREEIQNPLDEDIV